MRVRFVDDGLHFVHRHLVLVDELDNVDSRVSELLHFSFAVGCAFDAPAEVIGAGIRLVLNEWTGDVKGRSGNFAAIDPVTQTNALLERTAEIACTGHTGHEQLSCGRWHDLATEPRRIRFVPIRVITVTEYHGMDVAIPEARQHVHAFGRNNFRIGGHLQRADGADGGDTLLVDDDHAVREWMAAKAVNEAATDKR